MLVMAFVMMVVVVRRAKFVNMEVTVMIAAAAHHQKVAMQKQVKSQKLKGKKNCIIQLVLQRNYQMATPVKYS